MSAKRLPKHLKLPNTKESKLKVNIPREWSPKISEKPIIQEILKKKLKLKKNPPPRISDTSGKREAFKTLQGGRKNQNQLWPSNPPQN